MNSKEAKAWLQNVEWQEGRIVTVTEGPYRHRIVVHCSDQGRQKAEFANGDHSYFGYVELVDSQGGWIRQGVSIVPVLPDRRLIMVIEQRPAQSRFDDMPTMAKIQGRNVDLRTFGPHSSLEFPGGAIDPNEGLKAGFLREFQEETGAEEQKAVLLKSCHPIYFFGSDLALRGYVAIALLSGLNFQNHVETDGGLNVVALTRNEVQTNLFNGTIHSGQAAIAPWQFYMQVEPFLENPSELIRAGYLSVEEVKVRR
ncbi:MAG: NUDIX domain-containing protein [Candidatus Staskawiczbacteria bacterium]|nr:NUDIX domain-containing protein [Candidatus Staskawiczbacteria bacterium]